MEESAGYVLTDALMPYAKRDYGRALALLAPLAEQGNAVAQLKLGVIFSRGKTGSPDHVAALGWFTKAAEQGQVEAQFELGRIYRDGLGTRVDGNAGFCRRQELVPARRAGGTFSVHVQPRHYLRARTRCGAG